MGRILLHIGHTTGTACVLLPVPWYFSLQGMGHHGLASPCCSHPLSRGSELLSRPSGPSELDAFDP